MDKYTIRDYDKRLDVECGMYPYQVPLWKAKRINETKGIVDDYFRIADELYNALIHEEPISFNDENSYLQYAILDYKFKQDDLFMSSCNIVVLTGALGNSSFLGRDVEILSDSLKMSGGKFTIRIRDKFLDSENGKNEFYELMAHEVQHAYRFYNIFLSNNSYSDEDKSKMERCINAYNIQQNASNILEYIVTTIYYLSERNEISSESNKLYEFLRNHEEIGEGNIDDYLNDELPLFSMKTNLKNFLEEMDSKMKLDDMSYIKQVGENFKKIIRDRNLTPYRAFIKFRTRIVDAAMFANRLFKRTLSKAFDDFDRRIKLPNGSDLAREMTEANKDFELLREILNRN